MTTIAAKRLIALAVATAGLCGAGTADAGFVNTIHPIIFHPVHGPGSSHNPIINPPPVHGPGSSHNPIINHPLHGPGSSHNPIISHP
jgi:hypothetical protein